MRKNVLITGGTGYIGSRLTPFLKEHHEVITCDLALFGGKPDMKCRYQDIKELGEFDTIIHLAGHSSVPWADFNKQNSYANNVKDFHEFVKRIRRSQRLIYASSGSVYGGLGAGKDANGLFETESLPPPIREYDRQKQFVDTIVSETLSGNYCGMRFGTVCGMSPTPRNELLINAMVKSYIKDGKITATGSNTYRSVLGLDDLCRGVLQVVNANGIDAGYYNMASDYGTIGRIGVKVAYALSGDNSFEHVDIKSSGGNGYSFVLNTNKFENAFAFKFEDTISSIAWRSKLNDFNISRSWNITV